MTSKKIALFFVSVLLSLVAFSTAKADPVSFSNVVGLPNINLASNPNILTATPQLNFSLDIHGAGAQADAIQLQLSFHESGQSALTQNFAVPLFDGLSDYTQLFNFQAQNPTFGGTPVTLTVSLVNTLSGAILQSQTYNFTVSQPVPEPATISLLALGVVGLLSRKKRR
jgi:hypothetical protein